MWPTRSHAPDTATERLAKARKREVIYLDSPSVSKEETARQIAERDGIREVLFGPASASPGRARRWRIRPSAA